MTLRELFTGKILEMELSDLAPIADLVLAIVLGSIAVYIAFQQWRTHQRRVESEQRDRCVKRKDDLFDRRWKIYVGVGEFLDAMSPLTMTGSAAAQQASQKDDFEIQDLARQNLRRLMLTAQFLFERDVNEYLEELDTRCQALLRMELHCRSSGGELPKQGVEEWRWLSDNQRLRELNQRFERYLRLS